MFHFFPIQIENFNFLKNELNLMKENSITKIIQP
jgi:hypothetical protein